MICGCGCGIIFLLTFVSSVVFSNWVHYIIFIYHIFLLILNKFYFKKHSYNIHIIIAIILNLTVLLTKLYKGSLPIFIEKYFPILWTIVASSNTVIFITRIVLSFINKNKCHHSGCDHDHK